MQSATCNIYNVQRTVNVVLNNVQFAVCSAVICTAVICSAVCIAVFSVHECTGDVFCINKIGRQCTVVRTDECVTLNSTPHELQIIVNNCGKVHCSTRADIVTACASI
jgi:hypothetical protein